MHIFESELLELYRTINAAGGYSNNKEEERFNETIHKLLDVLEEDFPEVDFTSA